MDIRRYSAYDRTEILSLYESVGWTSYTENPEMLEKAFSGSLAILGAYDHATLVGIVRIVGDGASIIYVQDLLVRPEYHRKGVGSALLSEALSLYPDAYQTVLLTDNNENTSAFYRKHGFNDADLFGIKGFIKISRKG